MEYQFESMGPTIRIVVLVFLLVSVLIALGLVVLLAALPGHIARTRKHPQATAINVCGLLGLPTGVLWVLAMVWANLESTSDGASQQPSKELTSVSEQLVALEQAIAKLESAQAKGPA